MSQDPKDVDKAEELLRAYISCLKPDKVEWAVVATKGKPLVMAAQDIWSDTYGETVEHVVLPDRTKSRLCFIRYVALGESL